MNKKETKILDKLIAYLSEKSDKIQSYRNVTGINPQFTFLREVETIESLYISVLQERKKVDSPWCFVSTSGWTVMYLREKKKHKEGEKFHVKIYFSFVDEDNLEL